MLAGLSTKLRLIKVIKYVDARPLLGRLSTGIHHI